MLAWWGEVGAAASRAGPPPPRLAASSAAGAFDHMLGHLALTDPRVNGLAAPHCMPLNPVNASGPQVCTAFDAVDGGPVDPLHDFDSITHQVYGFAKPMANKTAPEVMNGFAAVATKGEVDFVLSAFNASSLPVLSTLATEFALFDAWHVSVPTCTNPNREFLMSGQSNGYTVNTIPTAGFPQTTHFAFLEERGLSWKIYYVRSAACARARARQPRVRCGGHLTQPPSLPSASPLQLDDPWMAPTFADLRTPARLARVQEASHFFSDLADGTLPRYSLIQPRMATSKNGTSNWQHPDNSVGEGEQFLADVYTALRTSAYWEDTVLIVTYDEHGGFADHVPPPSVGVPAPNSIIGDNDFDFSRLGVRVPTVVISPWVARNSVIHAPAGVQAPTATSQFDATSIIATSNRLFGIQENLTARDAWAGVFVNLLDGSAGMRRDCPLTLPAALLPDAATVAREAATPLNDHHFDSLNLLCHLARHVHAACARHASPDAQAAFVARLRSESGGAPDDDGGVWRLAGDYPHLFADAARLLQQQHFGDISRELFSAYKADVGVSA